MCTPGWRAALIRRLRGQRYSRGRPLTAPGINPFKFFPVTKPNAVLNVMNKKINQNNQTSAGLKHESRNEHLMTAYISFSLIVVTMGGHSWLFTIFFVFLRGKYEIVKMEREDSDCPFWKIIFTRFSIPIPVIINRKKQKLTYTINLL